MEDPQHLLAHSQLLAQLQHGGASHHNPLVFVQGKPMPPPLQQHAASHAQPAVFLGGQNLVWAPKDPPSLVPGQRLPQPSANANQAAMMQAMMHANQMQLGGNNSIATAAAAAAMATSQQTRATQAQVLSVANLMQQQQQAQQHRQQQQQFLAQNQQSNAMQAGNWLSAMPQRGAAPGPVVLESGKPLLAAQPLSAADRTALQHRQLLLLAAQQQQQQRPQQQQQQQELVQQLQAVLASQQAGQGIAPSQLNNMLSSLWSQQQQQQEAQQQAAMAAAQQQAVQQAQRKIRQNMAALAHLTPGQLQALANNQALNGHMNQGQMQVPNNMHGGNGSPAAMLLQAQSQAQTQALLQAHARANMQAAARANMQASAAKAAAAKPPLQAMGPSAADALLASQRLTEQRLKGHTQAAHTHRVSDAAGANIQAATSPAAIIAGLQLPPELAAGQGNAGGGSPPSHAPLSSLSQEQRRSALVCVAMQLVQNNITVDQAIHSGIMGGLSVTDVKYIIEVHDAHLARVKQSQQQQQVQHLQAELAAVRAADQLLAAGAYAHGNMRAQPKPMPAQMHTQARPASGSASPALSVGSVAESDASALAKGAYALGGGGSGSAPPSVVGGAPARSGVAAEESFDAFSYGFFGGPAAGGDLLQELESADADGALDGNSGDIPSWLSEGALPDAGSWHEVMTASANADLADSAAQGAAAPEVAESPKHDSNDVAARLANLDLGYGFF